MYEEYMQNFLNYPVNGYRNTYDQMVENYPYSYSSQNMFEYDYNQNWNDMQNRNSMQIDELESCYPEIYKVVYPMVRKVCMQNTRGFSRDTIDSMVEEVYSNIESNDAIELNITLNNDVRGETSSENSENRESKVENRQIRRNSGLNDLIRILILRELLGRPGCFGPNCRPGPRPPRPPFPGPGPRPPRPPRPGGRPPFPRYDFGEME
jgi:hypothetical protein